MKRTILLIALALCTTTLHAENGKERVRMLGAKCDSRREQLADMRSEYARRTSIREELTPKILKAESELLQYTQQYDAAILALSQQEGQALLKAYATAKLTPDSTSISAGKERTTTPTFTSNTKRNLIANDFFTSQLSNGDYKTLQEAQLLESRISALAGAYPTHYSEILSLQRRYMEVETPQQADSIALLFNRKIDEIRELDEELSKGLSALFFNKSYIYDLLMERGEYRAMLDLSASLATVTEREIEKNNGLYISDALMSYHLRKKHLVEYELQLAELISADKARDSLKLVANDLKQRDFKLSPITLQRRSFIKYEPISVKSSTYYNSKNPIPQTDVQDYGTVYRIRIGLFKNRPNISALRGITPLSYIRSANNGLYAYFVGGFRTEQEANDGVAYLKRLGFKEPIIAAWVDGEYYPTLDALRQKLNRYTIEISGIASLPEEVKAKIIQHNADCTISRIGSKFVVGLFDAKGDAEALATELKTLSSEMSIEVVKKP